MERSVLLRRTVGTGLVGGIAVVYLAAVGMIEQFNVRNLISDIVTLGKVMVCLPPFLAGYLAARPRVRHGRVQRPTARQTILVGAGTGAVAGLTLLLFLMLVHGIGVDAVRGIFISI